MIRKFMLGAALTALTSVVQAEADRYGRFLQTPVRLIITK